MRAALRRRVVAWAVQAYRVTELRELRQLREENRKLKGLVADLSLDKTILQEALRRKW